MTIKGGRAGARPRLLLVLAAVALIATAIGWRLSTVRQQGVLHERSGLLMGTFVNLRAAGPAAPAGLDAAMAEIERLERLFDYGRPESDVGRLNAAAGQGPVTIQPETVTVLSRALYFAEISQGVFDPTIAPLVDVWGFRPDALQAVPGEAAIRQALDLIDWRMVRLDEAAGAAELLRPDMRVDLGGIAKGYAVDQAVAVLRDAGVRSAILDIGGQVYVIGLRNGALPWRVGLQHPRRSEALLGVLTLTEQGVATSGDYQRFFEFEGQRYHHIFDPRTGWPATGLIAVAVVGGSGLDVDAVSTIAYILGPDAGLDFVRMVGLDAVLYTVDEQTEVTEALKPLFEAQPR